MLAFIAKMVKIIKNQHFVRTMCRRFVLCMVLLCLSLNVQNASAQLGTSCSNARTTIYGDYWMSAGQSLWFTGTLESISDGFSCYWFSADTLDIDFYISLPYGGSCPGNYVYGSTAVPNGTYELTPEYMNYRIQLAIEEYGLPELMVKMCRAYLSLTSRTAGRLFVNKVGVAPQSTAAGPFQAVEYNRYLINAETNAYYQIAWHGETKPDSIYVAWQPKDSADGFRADLLDKYPKIQFRQKNNAGVSKGTPLRVGTTNLFLLRPDAFSVATAAGDSLFASFINVPDDGYFRFLALYNAADETETVELCAGKSLELSNGTYDQSGLCHDTIRNSEYIYAPEYWHRTIRTFDLHIAEPEVRETIELQVPELPAEYNGLIFTTEGLHNLNFIDEDGCSYIQPVNVTLETAISDAELLGLHIVPSQPKAGEPMTITTDNPDHALYIYSISGKLVAQGRVGIPITAPQQGIYLLRISNKTIKLKIE